MPYYPDDFYQLFFGDSGARDPESMRAQLSHMDPIQMQEAIMRSFFGAPAADASGATGEGARRVEVTADAGSAANSGEMERLRAENAQLKKQLAEKTRDYQRVRKDFETQLENTKIANGNIRKCKRLLDEARQDLSRERTHAAELTDQMANLTRSIDAKDSTITALRQQFRELQDQRNQLDREHRQLLSELEAQTDAYTKRKRAALDAELASTMAAWSQECQRFHPAPVDHSQAQEASRINDELRSAMLASTTQFQKDLASLHTAMENLEATRSALRKELDTWQQGLYAARYDRLALCLQLLDTEIWRAMESSLARSVRDDGTPEMTPQGSAELIDHLQILAQNLKGACEGFGLTFFYPEAGASFNVLRHQAFNGQMGSTIAACVSPGVEALAGDGSTALIRPAIVTLT